MRPTTNRAMAEAEFDIEGMIWNIALALAAVANGGNTMAFFNFATTWMRM